MSKPAELIVKTKHFEPEECTYLPPRVNTRGGKSCSNPFAWTATSYGNPTYVYMGSK